MSPEAQRSAIAEACGWVFNADWTGPTLSFSGSVGSGEAWTRPDGRTSFDYEPPDYLNDLNAMHKAEKVLLSQGDDWGVYCDHLMDIVVRAGGYQNADTYVHASAAQRAEAFLRTLTRWDDNA